MIILVNQLDIKSHVLEMGTEFLADQLGLLQPGLILSCDDNSQILLVKINSAIMNHQSTYITDPGKRILVRQEGRQLVKLLAEHRRRRSVCAGLVSLTNQSSSMDYSRNIRWCSWSSHGGLECKITRLISSVNENNG